MNKSRIAVWKGYRFQENGVVFIADTNNIAKEKVSNGYRYVSVEDNGRTRWIKVSKIIYALFNRDNIIIKKFNRLWDIEHKDGNTLNCQITNLQFREHHSSKMPVEVRRKIIEQYEKGERGHGYHTVAKDNNLYMYQVKNIIDQEERRKATWETKK